MFESISKKWNTSWSLVKTSWFYVSRDGELFMYGLLSFIFGSLLPIGALLFLLFTDFINESTLQYLQTESGQILIFVIGFIYYLVWSIIKYFFQAAIMTSIERRLEGKDNSFGDGISSACSRFQKIFVWSLLESVVYSILNFIRNRFGKDSLIGKAIAGMLGFLWEVSTYFSFAILILTSRGIKESINESGKLFTKTWGERAIVAVGTGFILFIIALPIIILGAFATTFFLINSFVIAGIASFVLMLFVLQIISIVTNVFDSIIKVLLLYYAMSGKMPEKLETTDIVKIRNGGEKV